MLLLRLGLLLRLLLAERIAASVPVTPPAIAAIGLGLGLLLRLGLAERIAAPVPVLPLGIVAPVIVAEAVAAGHLHREMEGPVGRHASHAR